MVQGDIVVPLGVEDNHRRRKADSCHWQFQLLATIGDFIKQRAIRLVWNANLLRSLLKIFAFLDQAAQQRLISGEGLEHLSSAMMPSSTQKKPMETQDQIWGLT